MLRLSFINAAWLSARSGCVIFFFFNDTATTEIYTLSLHDALPICRRVRPGRGHGRGAAGRPGAGGPVAAASVPVLVGVKSEEHTSELQSRLQLVCPLLLEKKNIFWIAAPRLCIAIVVS